jgi:hypothetical protein
MPESYTRKATNTSNEAFPVFNPKLPCGKRLEPVSSTEGIVCDFDIRSALSTDDVKLARIIVAYCKVAPVLNAARHGDV